MSQRVEDKVEEPHYPGEIEVYGDPGIATFDAPVPGYLKFSYIFWILVGLFTQYVFWNGSVGGWLDKGYWRELQIAANTTLPLRNENMPVSEDYQQAEPPAQGL